MILASGGRCGSCKTGHYNFVVGSLEVLQYIGADGCHREREYQVENVSGLAILKCWTILPRMIQAILFLSALGAGGNEQHNLGR